MTKQYVAYGGLGRYGYDDSKNYPSGWPGAGTGRVALAGTQVHLTDAPTAAENALRLGDNLAGGFYPMPINWIIVDADGNGHYATIQAAINAVDSHRENSSTWIGILIYPGTYTEALTIGNNADYIMLMGFSNQTKITNSNAVALTIADGSDSIEISNLTLESTGPPYPLSIGACDNVSVKSCILSAVAKSCFISMAAEDEVSFVDTFFSGVSGHIVANSSAAAKATFHRCSFHTTGSGIYSLDILSNMTIELYGCTWWADNACNVGIFRGGESDSTVLISRGSLDTDMSASPWAGSQESGCTLTLYAINGTGWPTWATWLATETVSIHELVGENGEYITNVTDGHWRFWDSGGVKYFDMNFTGANHVIGTDNDILTLPDDTRAVEFTDTSNSSTSSQWKSAYDHISANGSSHGFINQSVVNGASPTFAAVTATSFVIGDNTLGTNEWAFLDGLDQALKVADSPEFANIYVPVDGVVGFEGSGGDSYIYYAAVGNEVNFYVDNALALKLTDSGSAAYSGFTVSGGSLTVDLGANIAGSLEVGTSAGDHAKFFGGDTEGVAQSYGESMFYSHNVYRDSDGHWHTLDTSDRGSRITLWNSNTVSKIKFGTSSLGDSEPSFIDSFVFDLLTGELQLVTGFIDQDGATANTFASDINAAAGVNLGTTAQHGILQLSNGTAYTAQNWFLQGIIGEDQSLELINNSGSDRVFYIRNNGAAKINVSIDGGLNVGSATEAGIGDIHVSGNIGIGTIAPGAPLTINRAIGIGLRIENDDYGELAGMRFRSKHTGGENLHADIVVDSTGNNTGTMQFRIPHTATRMTLQSDGGVFMYGLKSGTTQVNADAAADELWVDNNKMVRIGV